jgi:hypothetical protein
VFREQGSKKHLQIRAMYVVLCTGLYGSPHTPKYPVGGCRAPLPAATRLKSPHPRTHPPIAHSSTHASRHGKVWQGGCGCVCVFAWTHARVPPSACLQGLQGFLGERLHARNATDPEQARDKDVLIIGSGRSHFDIAAVTAAASSARSISLLYHKVCGSHHHLAVSPVTSVPGRRGM